MKKSKFGRIDSWLMLLASLSDHVSNITTVSTIYLAKVTDNCYNLINVITFDRVKSGRIMWLLLQHETSISEKVQFVLLVLGSN
jgi:hypothetical protein